jgi:hypothetical protein
MQKKRSKRPCSRYRKPNKRGKIGDKLTLDVSDKGAKKIAYLTTSNLY